jgi:hypothetical protein
MPLKSLNTGLWGSEGGSGTVSATFDDVMTNGAPYEDFSSAPLSATKWWDWEIVRDVVDGQLHMDVLGYGQRTTNDIYLRDEYKTDYFQADVTIRSDSFINGDDSSGEFRLIGTYYNSQYDGSGYNRDEGEVWAFNRIRHYSDGSLTNNIHIFRCDDADCNSSTELFDQDLNCTVELDTPVTLSIEKKGATLSFCCGQERVSHTLTGPLYAPNYKYRRFRTRGYPDPTGSVYLKTSVDNVYNSKSFPWTQFLTVIQAAAARSNQ